MVNSHGYMIFEKEKNRNDWYTHLSSFLTWAASAALGEAVDAESCTGDDVVELTGAGDEEVFVVLEAFSEVELLAVAAFGAVGVLETLVFAVSVTAVVVVALLVAVVFALAGVVVALLALLAAAP